MQRLERRLIVLIPLIAFATTLIAWRLPDLLPLIIAVDLWLLGYHHVIATFTRTAFDKEMALRYWRLNLLLPLIVFIAVLLIGKLGGAVLITTIYIHWQLYHYIRQSEGISKSFAARQINFSLPNSLAFRAAFYTVPAMSFLEMSAASSGSFLGFPVWLPQLPRSILNAGWIFCGALLVHAVWKLVHVSKEARESSDYVTYIFSHFMVFFVAYGIFSEVTLSWLMANIWHNTQYLFFVWKANHYRFKGQISSQTKVLSTLSLPRNFWLYITTCLIVTYLLYDHIVPAGIDAIESNLTADAVLAAAIIYQTINFHHYIVDAIIWRRRKETNFKKILSA